MGTGRRSSGRRRKQETLSRTWKVPTFIPHDYQETAISFLLGRILVDDEPGAGLFLDPGLGKTAISLESLWRMKRVGAFRPTMIIAPLRVIYGTWPTEIKDWRYPFSWTIVHGDARKRENELLKNVDLYLINPEAINWLARTYAIKSRHRFRPEFLVVDESTKFKNWSAKRTVALRSILPRFKKRWILTGTPAPNSYTDLPAQQFIVDNGEALGKTIGAFRLNYCQQRASAYHPGGDFEVLESMQSTIEERIAPSTLRMNCEDYLDMPERLDHMITVELPPKARAAYDDVERQLWHLLESGETLEASNAGAKYSLCKQMARGGSYYTDDDGERRVRELHEAKLEALVDLVDELNGKPLLVAYQYGHDAERIRRAFPKAPVIRGGVKPAESTRLCEEWNAGKHHVFLVQPQALSHGANMQFGGADLAWFGHTDQLEIYIQFNARLWRQGQKLPVRLHHFIADDTVDLAVWDRLGEKGSRQDALLKALENYRKAKQ